MNATRKRVAFNFIFFEKLFEKVLTTQEKYAIIYTSKQMLVPVRRRTVRVKHSDTKHRERNYRRYLQNTEKMQFLPLV